MGLSSGGPQVRGCFGGFGRGWSGFRAAWLMYADSLPGRLVHAGVFGLAVGWVRAYEPRALSCGGPIRRVQRKCRRQTRCASGECQPMGRQRCNTDPLTSRLVGGSIEGICLSVVDAKSEIGAPATTDRSGFNHQGLSRRDGDRRLPLIRDAVRRTWTCLNRVAQRVL